MPTDTGAGGVLGYQDVRKIIRRNGGKLAGPRAQRQQELRDRSGLFQLFISEIVMEPKGDDASVSFVALKLKWLKVECPELIDKRSLFIGTYNVRLVAKALRLRWPRSKQVGIG
jgi:hypothetical protein